MINIFPYNSYIPIVRSWYETPEHSQKSVYKDESVSTSAQNNSEKIMKTPAEVNFGGRSPSKVSKFYTSDAVKKVLEFAERKQLIFDAAFALLLTCILRPASIMVLPSKKNQDDQKYAAAHSVASGIIGFAISNILFTPISNGIKKLIDSIKTNPEKFITDRESYLFKDNKKCLMTAKTYLDRLPDVVCSIPKGILTVALIPPILKYVFGMEKKKGTDNKLSPVTNFKSAIDAKNLNFTSSGMKDKKVFQSIMLGGVR